MRSTRPLSLGVSGPLSTATNKPAVNNTPPACKPASTISAGEILADSCSLHGRSGRGFHRFVWGAGTDASSEVCASPRRLLRRRPIAAGRYDPIGGHLKVPREAASSSVWFGTYCGMEIASRAHPSRSERTPLLVGAALGVDIGDATFVIGAAAGASTGKLKSVGRPDWSTPMPVMARSMPAATSARSASMPLGESYAFAALDTSRSISLLNHTATSSSNAQTLASSSCIHHRRSGRHQGRTVRRPDWFASHQATDLPKPARLA